MNIERAMGEYFQNKNNKFKNGIDSKDIWTDV